MIKLSRLLKPMGAIALAVSLFAGTLSIPVSAASIGGSVKVKTNEEIAKGLLNCVEGLSADKRVKAGDKLTLNVEKAKKVIGYDVNYITWHYEEMPSITNMILPSMTKSDSFDDDPDGSKGYVVPAASKPAFIGVSVNHYTSVPIKYVGMDVDQGTGTFDLSSGSKVVSLPDLIKYDNIFYGILTPVYATASGNGSLKVSGLTIYADLDKDGNFDVSIDGLKQNLVDTGILYMIGLDDKKPVEVEMPEPEIPEDATEEERFDIYLNYAFGRYAVTVNVLPTTNLNGSYTVELPTPLKNRLEENMLRYHGATNYIFPVKVNSEADDVDASMKVPGIKKVTKDAKSITVELKALKKKQLKKVTGYEIQYSTKSDFSDAKTVKVNKAKTTKKTIKKLKKGTTYFVRVRYFKKGAAKPYSNWSKVKKLKTKK